MRNRKIFISHSSKDKETVVSFVNLLESIGITEEQLFCSSVPGYWIPVGKDLFDYLASQFNENDLFVVFMLSDNYYQSPVCLNEMGAAWIKKTGYQVILMPGFEYKAIEGAVNPRDIGFKLDDIDNLRFRLNEFKAKIVKDFSLSAVSDNIWERHRDQFIKSIQGLKRPVSFNDKRVYAEGGHEHIVITKLNTGYGENSGSARVDFSNTKLPHVPAFAGLAYIFSDSIDVRGYSSLAFDINTDGKIKRIDVEIKPEGKRWMHDVFTLDLSAEERFVVDTDRIKSKTQKCIEEICFVIKPNYFNDEQDMTSVFTVKNIRFA